MEMLIVAIALTGLAVLSVRYGHDSRDWRPGPSLVGWAVDRAGGAGRVSPIDFVYPELASARAAQLRQEAAAHRVFAARARTAPGRRVLAPAAVALGGLLVRCGQLLLSLAAGVSAGQAPVAD